MLDIGNADHKPIRRAQSTEEPTGQLQFQNITKDVAAQFDAGVTNIGQGNVPSGSGLGQPSSRRSPSTQIQIGQAERFSGHKPTQNDAGDVTRAVTSAENIDGAAVMQRRARDFTLGQIVEENEVSTLISFFEFNMRNVSHLKHGDADSSTFDRVMQLPTFLRASQRALLV